VGEYRVLEESNKRFLTSGIAHIEKKLQNINEILLQHESKSQFTIIIDDIEPEVRKLILNLVNDMLDQIRQMKKDFGLEQKSIEKSKHVRVQLSDINIILDDLTPKNLESYGKLDQADAHLLGLRLAKISMLLKEIGSIL
jgi:hypothetical protein